MIMEHKSLLKNEFPILFFLWLAEVTSLVDTRLEVLAIQQPRYILREENAQSTGSSGPPTVDWDLTASPSPLHFFFSETRRLLLHQPVFQYVWLKNFAPPVSSGEGDFLFCLSHPGPQAYLHPQRSSVVFILSLLVFLPACFLLRIRAGLPLWPRQCDSGYHMTRLLSPYPF